MRSAIDRRLLGRGVGSVVPVAGLPHESEELIRLVRDKLAELEDVAVRKRMDQLHEGEHEAADAQHETGSSAPRAIRLIEAAGPGAVRDFMAAYGQDFDYLGIDRPTGW